MCSSIHLTVTLLHLFITKLTEVLTTEYYNNIEPKSPHNDSLCWQKGSQVHSSSANPLFSIMRELHMCNPRVGKLKEGRR